VLVEACRIARGQRVLDVAAGTGNVAIRAAMIGTINFTPEGTGGVLFRLFALYAPPPSPGALSPSMCGNEEHVRKLFGQQAESLEMSRREYVERAASPRAYLHLFKETFGPVVAIYSNLADRRERSAALSWDLLEFVRRSNRGTSEGPIQVPYEYLLVLARKRR